MRLSAAFLEMHIRPFSGDQVERFVHNWYTVVEKGLAKDPEQAESIAKEKADSLVKRLKEPDFRAAHVFELTRNPLLLTNICLVHRHRGELPQKRARLYKECIEVLLEHWRRAKGLSVGITGEEGIRALQPAAYWLHSEEGRTQAKEEDLVSHIQPVLNALKWKKGTGSDFFRMVRDDSGLLTGWDQEHYGFIHLGFQEYLAAREIRDRSFEDPLILNKLASCFGESWWREVILLLLALEEPSRFVPFMREVLKQPAFGNTKHSSLVDACMEDAAEKSPTPFIELLEIDPGNDKGLWDRQLVALKVLERLDSDAVNGLRSILGSHPYAKLRNRIAGKGGYELIRIQGGEFMMGSPETEQGRYTGEGPLHRAIVPDFNIGRYPVTNEEYGLFLSENHEMSVPEYWLDSKFNKPGQPVVGVSWEDARQYAKWAGLRLPTEAEWEYACRANTRTRYYLGNKEEYLERAGWYEGNSGYQLQHVGEKEPNGFGLYDMHGNVWEYVEDDWHGSYEKAPNDGCAWIDSPRGSKRVIRGGSWYDGVRLCRSAVRYSLQPGVRDSHVGFRLSIESSRDKIQRANDSKALVAAAAR